GHIESDFVIPFIPLTAEIEEKSEAPSLIYRCVITLGASINGQNEGWLETQWVAVFRFNTVNADVVYYQTQPIFPSGTSRVRSPSPALLSQQLGKHFQSAYSKMYSIQ